MCDRIFILTLNKQCNGTALLPLSFPNLQQANATTNTISLIKGQLFKSENLPLVLLECPRVEIPDENCTDAQ